MLTRDSIEAAIRSEDPSVRARFFDALPPSGLKDAARPLFVNGPSTASIVVMYSLAQDLCNGRNPALGAPLAEVLCTIPTELVDANPDSGLAPTTLSGLADCHVKALNLLGRSEEAVAAVARYVRLCERLGERVNLPQIKVRGVEALLNLDRIDDADRALSDDSLFRDPVAAIEARRLRGIIDRRKAAIHDLKPEGDPAPAPTDVDDLRGALESVLSDDDGPAAVPLDFLEQLTTSRRLDPTDPAELQRLLEVLRAGESMLTQGHGDSELAIGARIRDASVIFVHGRPPPDRIPASLAELEACLAWARTHEVSSLRNDALWGLYLCHSRLGDSSRAADALIELRRHLEGARAHIADPARRGGVFGAYRYLFHATCEHLYEAGRPRDLLEAIEASKGRAIADRLTENRGAAVADAEIYEAVHRLPELTASVGFHYLTFFVDEPCIRAAIVTRDGRIHAPPPIKIDSETLASCAADVDPRKWGVPLPWNPASSTPDVAARLAPVGEWLGALVDAGLIRRDDHICYSPDDSLHDIPLHYLPLRGERLIDWFSMSRVHSSFHLRRVLAGEGARPSSATAFVVPGRGDLRKPAGAQMVGDFEAPARWLAEHLGATVVWHADATLARVGREPLAGSVVHFSTHGWFPKGAVSPYTDSYLLLAADDGLPDVKAAARGDRSAALTPRWLLERDLRLDGSHVSLMACISGLAREGSGGDSLGLDWAFIQCGAASLLSSHWKVSAASAARFLTTFYTHWLSGGRSRAAAHRRSVRELLAGDTSPAALHRAAAFSLTGDFR